MEPSIVGTAGPPGEDATMETFVDSSVFLGMHAAEDSLRRSCKSFFVSAMLCPLAMGYEEVARCDDVVWSKPRSVQDDYYPFMDRLHTDLSIRRLALCQSDIDVAGTDRRLAGLPDRDRFAVAIAICAGTRMISTNPRLLEAPNLPVAAPPYVHEEARFPYDLEALYQRSLVLRLPLEEVVG